jgi:hypothetical protein
MAADRPPISFRDYTRNKAAKGSSASPVSIKADDLDKNFMWAGLVVEEAQPEGADSSATPFLTIEERVVGGHVQRVLKVGELAVVETFAIEGGVAVSYDALVRALPEPV